jgi:hypothetical protein
MLIFSDSNEIKSAVGTETGVNRLVAGDANE